MNHRAITWTEAFQKKGFIVRLIFFSVSIVIVVSLLPYFFLSIIGPKQGVVINDLLLSAFAPQDYSWFIFALIYLSFIITLQGLYNKPEMILHGLKCYLMITLFRMISMYTLTLEPPVGIIPLHDPIVDVIAYGGNVFNKDLFFSGHIATLTLFVLLEDRPLLKKILIVNSFLVAVLILLQRVHYTIDVVVAPFITVGIHRIIKRVES